MTMLQLALAGFRTRKLRFLMTAFAVVIGVGFVSGSFVLGDGITRTFDDLFRTVNAGIDVAVRSDEADPSAGVTEAIPGAGDPNARRIDEAVLDTVREVPGVRVADAVVQGSATVLGSDGKPIGPPGPPKQGLSWSERSDIARVHVVAGRGPEADDEVALDVATARTGKLDLGEDVTVLFEGGRKTGTFELVGAVQLGDSESLQGATLAFFERGTIQRYLDTGSRVDAIVAQAEDGVSQEDLKRRVQAAVGSDVQVITGEQGTQEDIEQIGQLIDFVRYAALGFAAISLFVAAFIIFNTFSILVAQRMRELGLLRAVGATTRQVLLLIVGESLVVGIVASAVGVVFGLGVALGLRALLDAAGFSLPSGELVLEPRTVLVAMLVGIAVTLAAALVPALRAGRMPALEALRAAAGARQRSRLRAAIGWTLAVLLLAIGAALLAWGLLEASGVTNVLAFVGAGFALLVIGITLSGSVLVRPVFAVVGLPVRAAGVAGHLALRNAVQNSRRTVYTAAALMIGLGLASFAAVFTESAQHSFEHQIERSVGADFILSNVASTDGFAYLPPEVQEQAADVEGVASAIGVKYSPLRVEGSFNDTAAVAADELENAFGLEVVRGSLADLDEGSLAVVDGMARERGWRIGDELRVKPGDDTTRLRLAATVEPFGLSNTLMTLDAYRQLLPRAADVDYLVFVDVAEGARTAEVRSDLEARLEGSKFVQIQNQVELKEQIGDQINQFLGLIYGLLALSVLTALFGIVNTLALSVFERTREIGLLRAVGMTRRQARRMVRWEAVLVSLLGGMLGMVLGLALGWAGVYALEEQGLTLAVPYGMTVVLLAASIAAGLLAAILPALRASRLSVLEAVSHD